MLSSLVVVLSVATTPDAQLGQAQNLAASLEYEALIPVVREFLERPDLSGPNKIAAYELLARALAVTGDRSGAENAFRLLLRVEPNYQPPEGTSPKIAAIFTDVKKWEDEIAAEAKEIELARLRAEVSIQPETPTEPEGGVPLPVTVRVTDPTSAIRRVRLHYRKKGVEEFSTLPLQQREEGKWMGALAADWTENEEGLVGEYFLTTHLGDDTVLLPWHSAAEPRRLSIAPGTLADAEPIYTKLWFWGVIAGAAVAVGVSTGVAANELGKLPPADAYAVVP